MVGGCGRVKFTVKNEDGLHAISYLSINRGGVQEERESHR